MLSHIYIGTNDLPAATKFYAAIFETLALTQKFKNDVMSGWMDPAKPRPLFVVGKPFDGGPASPGNGQMIALLAATRSLVDDVYKTALANGAQCEGPPGLRPQYHPDYYGAYFRDPDGNKLCICCHAPA